MKVSRRLSLRKDWAVVPGIASILIGTIVSIYDYVVLQHWSFMWSPVTVMGLIFIATALTLRTISRAVLNRAGFSGLGSTRLQIVEDQRLVTDGVYRFVRHPLYLGDLLRNYGFVLFFSSLYGFLFMVLANIFLLARIGMEEDMLIGAFGEEYREYMRRTWRLMPFIY